MAMTNLHNGEYYEVICGADDRYRIRMKGPDAFTTDETGRVLEYAFPFEANQAAQKFEGRAQQAANQQQLF